MARGTAIVLIVFLHSVTLLGRLPLDPPAWATGIAAFFAPMRMPVLIFLSGMLLPNSLLKGSVPYMDGKLRKLAWPLLSLPVAVAFMLASALSTTYRYQPELLPLFLMCRWGHRCGRCSTLAGTR